MTTAKRWIATDFSGIEGMKFVDYDVPAPEQGQVTVAVRAAGLNPADWKHVVFAPVGTTFPRPVGYEVAGVITAIGPDTEIASGGGAIGDEVLSFRTSGGFATSLNIPAKDVFAKPANVSFEEAAGLLLTGSTALDMMFLTGPQAGQTALVHGASGSVGVMLLQLLSDAGVKAIGTASEKNRSVVESFGGTWVAYGEGLADRVRAIGPVQVAYDCIGTDEAIDVSLELVAETGNGPDKIVSIANPARAVADGLHQVMGSRSTAYRDSVRADLIAKAAAGALVVPLGPTFPLDQAKEALTFLKDGHPGGKLTLIP